MDAGRSGDVLVLVQRGVVDDEAVAAQFGVEFEGVELGPFGILEFIRPPRRPGLRVHRVGHLEEMAAFMIDRERRGQDLGPPGLARSCPVLPGLARCGVGRSQQEWQFPAGMAVPSRNGSSFEPRLMPL